MDYSAILTLVLGLAYTVIPALMMAMLTGYSSISFMAFLAVFSAISIFFGYLPTWFAGVSILLISAVLYDTIAHRGQSS